LSRVHECHRQTDDRQTEHATEKRVAIGEKSAATMPPKIMIGA